MKERREGSGVSEPLQLLIISDPEKRKDCCSAVEDIEDPFAMSDERRVVEVTTH